MLLLLLLLLIWPLYSMQRHHDFLAQGLTAWMDEEANKPSSPTRISLTHKEEVPMSKKRKAMKSSDPLPCAHAEETNAKVKDKDLLRVLVDLNKKSLPSLANDTSDCNIMFQEED